MCSIPGRLVQQDRTARFRFGYDAGGVLIQWPRADIVAPVAVVSPQPANAKRPWRQHGEGARQFCEMLIDGRSNDIRLPRRR